MRITAVSFSENDEHAVRNCLFHDVKLVLEFKSVHSAQLLDVCLCSEQKKKNIHCALC